MKEIILFTYAAIFVAYAATYNADCQIVAPYSPFKLKKKKTVFSKYLYICKDRKRGMVTITFYMQMLAHVLLIISPIWLICIYLHGWYLYEHFTIMYRNILLFSIVTTFGFPTIIAVGLHNYIIRRKKSTIPKSNQGTVQSHQSREKKNQLGDGWRDQSGDGSMIDKK